MWVEIILPILLSRLFIPVHELGHVVMACLTKHWSGYNGKLNIKATVTVEYNKLEYILQPDGKTDTDLYEYLYRNKDSQNFRKRRLIWRIIRINSSAGLLFEIWYGFLCYVILNQLFLESNTTIITMIACHVLRVSYVIYMVVINKRKTHDIWLIIRPWNVRPSNSCNEE